MTENPEKITLVPPTINGVTDEQARQAAEVGRWSALALAHEDRAAWAARMARIASVDNPRVRETLMSLAGRQPSDEIADVLDQIGEFRETPFGVVAGVGGSDTLARVEFRARQAAEQRAMTEAESIRKALETKLIFGTPAEKRDAERELDRLDGVTVERDDVEP